MALEKNLAALELRRFLAFVLPPPRRGDKFTKVTSRTKFPRRVDPLRAFDGAGPGVAKIPERRISAILSGRK